MQNCASVIRRRGKGLLPWVNLMGLRRMQAAYREGQEWLDQLLVYLEANRDFVYDFVSNELPGLSMAKPEGTYLAWIDCRGAKLENPYKFFLDKARVAMSNGLSLWHGRARLRAPQLRLSAIDAGRGVATNEAGAQRALMGLNRRAL